MSKHPIWYMVIGITVMVVPAIVYLMFLIPQLSEEYTALMSSAGIIGGGGLYAIDKFPDKFKYSGLFKTSSRAFDALVVITLVQDFIGLIIGFLATVLASFIIFKILMGVYKDARRKQSNSQLAEEIARNIDKTIK